VIEDENELDKICKDIDNILSAFSILDQINVDLDPAFHPIEIEDIFREDIIFENKSDDIQLLLKDIQTYRRYIRGPKTK